MEFGQDDMAQFAHSKLPQDQGATARVQFGAAAAIGAVGIVIAGLMLASSSIAPALAAGLAVYGLGLGIAGRALVRAYPHAVLGLCNVVTLFRLVLVSILVMALFPQTAHAWVVFVLAAVALSLDGLDGWLARREGLVSSFGARFDMEVDSALALVLAVNAWLDGQVGALVLVLGVPRYVFGIAGLILPWLNGPLPERFSRKVICVVQIATLILLQLPVLPGLAADALVIGVALALIWSFERDVTWLWRASR